MIAHRMPREHFQWSFKFQCKTVKICFCEGVTSCREIDGRFAGTCILKWLFVFKPVGFCSPA